MDRSVISAQGYDSITSTGVSARRRRNNTVTKSKSVRYRIRKIEDSGVFFVLLWNLLVFSYLQSTLNNLIKPFLGSAGKHNPWISTIVSVLLTESLPQFLYPFAGWLADAKLGRYKVMRYSLWLIWAGSFFLILIAILKYVLVSLYDIKGNIHYYLLPFLVVIYALNAVGFAGYHVNVIPFGIDQMEDQSGENICAFIHWYYWTRNFNFGIIVQFAIESLPYYCHKSLRQDHQDGLDLINHVIQMAFLTAALCLDFLFSSKLKKDLKIHDPVKKVKDVSVFIARHDQLVGRRMAHTFVYDTPPVRSDFAKKSYGGPYEEDVVEDVTAFWRIVAFLLVTGVGQFLIQTGYYSYPNFVKHMQNSTGCSYEYIITNVVSVLTFTIVIPIHEFLIYPFFRKYIPRMTVRIGLGLIVILIGLSLLLTIDAMGHSHSGMYNASTCAFYHQNSSNAAIKISYTSLIPVIVVVSIGEMLVSISAFEFICAQSPYDMRGLILGLYFMINSLYMGAICMILTAFALGFKDYAGTSLSCGTWYIISIIALGIVGLVIYIVVANWYKKRQRGGQTNINHQTVLEGYYER